MIIAVDFDGVIVKDQYPEIGEVDMNVVNYLQELVVDGHKLILWTSRAGKQLSEAVDFCTTQGLVFDAVNQNLPEVIKKYRTDSRKVFADVYIDDRGVGYNYTQQVRDFLSDAHEWINNKNTQ